MRTQFTQAFPAVLLGLNLHLASGSAAVPDPGGAEFFEKRIRPILTERCYECHGPKKQKGGLRLDNKADTLKGGDSGPALISGQPEQSLLIKAVSYRDPDLQMPPKNPLPSSEVRWLTEWIKRGAPDPREATVAPGKAGIDLAASRQFWAYQRPRKAIPPAIKHSAWPRNDIDRFILAAAEKRGLEPVADADRPTLARRIYYDLVGLPPTPEQIDAFCQDPSPDASARLIDRLFATPQFGERWGRHWLDVVRFGESVTLRGLIFKQAWRYRDYVIAAFNRDLPYNRFVEEQIAGDLMSAAGLEERQRRLIAATFLALGNWNLEEQDKAQLRMDVVDEQLDTIGKAFLAQTIGCARCHDHKFDPIPTRDYYALAGILRSCRTLIDANVSNWIEVPLPVEDDLERTLKKHESAVVSLQARIKAARDAVANLAAGTSKGSDQAAILVLTNLPGVLVDDVHAKRVGDWRVSQFSRRYIGEGYLEDRNEGKGAKTLTFQPELPKGGRYEVRLAYVPGNSRAKNVPVTILSAEGETMITVNQQAAPPLDGWFIVLGQFRFEQNGQGYVLISNEGTSGHVTADAVQFISLEMLDASLTGTKAESVGRTAGATENDAQKATAQLKQLEAELKQLTATGPVRPMVMSVQEEEIGDTFVHVRGSVHNLGEKAPRGFLQVANYDAPVSMPTNQSGRLELGRWLASPSNPLTARVFVNRVWHWLTGAGLVRTTDNFGTTGEGPSHPELLDYLACRFVDDGWSIKRLIREIMLSRTYQLSTVPTEASLAKDPENRWRSRMNRRRLEAECLRDTILSVSGGLNLAPAGSTIQENTVADYGYVYTEPRRSVYVPVLRNALPELFELFDFADPSVVTGARTASTVSPQALFFLNHPFVREQARLAARRALAWTDVDDQGRLERACRLTFARPPSNGETSLARRLLSADAGEGSEAARLEAWTQLYHALFASMDFRYLN